MRTATVVWHISPELVRALNERFGPPIDSYVNGSQTWLLDNGPGDATLEWRLHPVAAYRKPGGLSHYDLWEQVVGQLSAGADPAALALGEERRALVSLWEGLEAFPAFDDEMEPVSLARRVTEAIGVSPDAVGLVDHEWIGAAWERARGQASIVGLLFEELQA